MYEKDFPIKLVDTVAGNPCITLYGDSFIWTSTNIYAGTRWNQRGLRMKKAKDHLKMKTKDDKGNDRERTNLTKNYH